MNRTKKLILLVAFLTLAVFVSGTMAQQAKPEPAPAKAASAPEAAKPSVPVKPEKFAGIIDKVDEMAKTIVVKGKHVEKTFAIDEKTKITKCKETLSFADLKGGMNVSVNFKKDGDKMVALAIKVATPKAPTPKQEGPNQ